MHHTKIKKHKFSLVEILAAMGVFMIAIAPLMGLLMRTTKVHTMNIKKIKAQMLAKEEMSRLLLHKNSANFATLPTNVGTTSIYAAHKKYNGLYYCVVSDALSTHTNLVKFTLYIGYSKLSTNDESYELYVAKAQ